jgi:F-type H+-transporting ATPase subunit a
MASAILHIKDSYYFEVPKFLWRYRNAELRDFPDVWISLDPHYQQWQVSKYLDSANGSSPEGKDWSAISSLGGIPRGNRVDETINAWKTWQHKAGNHGKPYQVYIDEYVREYWTAKRKAELEKKEFVAPVDAGRGWFARVIEDQAAYSQWKDIVAYFRPGAVKARARIEGSQWEAAAEPEREDIAAYNKALSGKIIIPQPFGRLRNLYEAESGFCISKYMVIELLVGLIMVLVFSWVAKKIRTGAAPKGKAWNLLETLLVFVKKDIAEKAIDHHYAHKYLPFLWTAFFFVLGCNLMGMIPWLGSPTASFGVTTALAFSTLLVVVVWAGMKKWGFFGFFKNLVPSMDLPSYLFPLKVLIVVMLFGIELLGLIIKHLVLAIRLLANMVAGHLVLVSILFIAFEVHNVQQMSGGSWYIAAPISILGVTALSLLELFVAFLQAYVFTFLSALFIDSVLHHH